MAKYCQSFSTWLKFSAMAKVTHPGRPKDEDPHVKCTTKNKKEVTNHSYVACAVRNLMLMIMMFSPSPWPWCLIYNMFILVVVSVESDQRGYDMTFWVLLSLRSRTNEKHDLDLEGDWVHRPWRPAGGARHRRDDLWWAQSTLWALWFRQVALFCFHTFWKFELLFQLGDREVICFALNLVESSLSALCFKQGYQPIRSRQKNVLFKA